MSQRLCFLNSASTYATDFILVSNPRCDKTACWSYNKRIYLFGGFGPPTYPDQPGYSFTEDPSTAGIYARGWSNQLVCYNTRSNSWEWPVTTGPTPLPRAAHAVSVIGDFAYVFGGRHQDMRMNDLHRLDLHTLSWSCVLPATDYPPVGRSWQVLVPFETARREGGLLMYGGFGQEEVTLSDCWLIDLHANPLSWVRCKHWEDGPRLWHAAAAADPGQILVIGGLTNNILAPSYILKHHAEKVAVCILKRLRYKDLISGYSHFYRSQVLVENQPRICHKKPVSSIQPVP
jgi:hypothetical protein